VEAIAPKLPKLDRELRAEPRVNGAIQRINRDVRFSKDKRPYKTALVLQFLPGGKVATSGAGFMIRIDATSLGFGTGLFGLTPGELGRYRTALCDGKAGPALLEAIAAATRKTPFDLTEPDLKRPPKGYEAAPGCEDLLRHKGLAVRGAEPHPAALFGKKAVDHCLKRLETLLPVQRWLNEHVPRGR